MDAYEKIKKVLALGFMNFLDENRPKDKMCLSNGECADIEKAFNEQDWPRLAGYLDKYTESEDERIRKAIVNLMEVASEAYLIEATGFKKEQFLSYLEKQKEHKPNYCHHEVDETGWTEEYRKAYYDGWNNCNMQHVQIKADQEPTEWSEEEEQMFGNILNHYSLIEAPTDGNGISKERYLAFIKSLRPSWKPSEEQMRTLYCVAYGIPNPDGIILMSLWNDLKKQK